MRFTYTIQATSIPQGNLKKDFSPFMPGENAGGISQYILELPVQK